MHETPKDEKNPFELIKWDGILVPEILTHPGRESDLAEYTKGWKDQSKNTSDQITPPTEKIGENPVRSAVNWYQVGAVKRYQSFDDHLASGTISEGHEKDLVDVMSGMRANPDLIPHDAWPNESDDEDAGTPTPRFS